MGEEDARKFIPFGEQLFTSCLQVANGPRMVKALEKADGLRRAGNMLGALCVLKEYHEKMEECRAFLAEQMAMPEHSEATEPRRRRHPMIPELAKWIKKYNLFCEIFGLFFRLLEGEEVKDELFAKAEIYNDSATVLTEFAFRAFLEKILEVF